MNTFAVHRSSKKTNLFGRSHNIVIDYKRMAWLIQKKQNQPRIYDSSH